MSTKVFGHEATLPTLDPSKAEIRILELQPGSPGSPIHCKFHVTTLDDLQFPYEALSYAWGKVDATTEQAIYLDDKQVKVMASLGDALVRLRLVDTPRYLWVDALCINQADNDEKTRQVGMMYRVYSQCEQGAIWLGQLGEIELIDAQAALDTVAAIVGARDTPGWFDDGSRRNAAAVALKAFINAPWWGRIWTVQEAILPLRATVYWGPCEIPWEFLHEAVECFFRGPKPVIPVEMQHNGAIIDLQCAMRGLYMSRGEELFRLLWRWRYRGATDPRDKVYGVMGFRRDISLPTVKTCDYTIDVRTLYQRVTADLIRVGGDLQPLIGRGGEVSDIPGLASWAVDWAGVEDGSKRSRSDFWDHRRMWHDRGYTADRGLCGVGEGLKVEGEDDGILRLHGLRVDRISIVEDASDDEEEEGLSSSWAAILHCGGARWGRLVTRFQEQHPGRLPDTWMSSLLGLLTGRLNPHDCEDGDGLEEWTRQMVRRQAVFVTESGRFGLGPQQSTRAGREVWVLGGSRVPVILEPRPRARDVSDEANGDGDLDLDLDLDFTFAGECFVYGVMRGEAVEGREDLQREIRLY